MSIKDAVEKFERYKEWCEYLNILAVDTRFNSFYNEHYKIVSNIISRTKYPKMDRKKGYGVINYED